MYTYTHLSTGHVVCGYVYMPELYHISTSHVICRYVYTVTSRQVMYTDTHISTDHVTCRYVYVPEFTTHQLTMSYVDTYIQSHLDKSCIQILIYPQTMSYVDTYICRSYGVMPRGGGLRSSTIFKKFNEPYAPS